MNNDEYQVIEFIGSNINREMSRLKDLSNPDEVVDVIGWINIQLFNMYCLSKGIDLTDYSELRCLATVQADKIKWDLHDYVDFIREMI